MLKLLRKDLILGWRPLAFTYVLWSALWLGGPALDTSGNLEFDVWSSWVSVGCAFLPIILIGREDKFKAWALACSLPVTRDAIVASRYLEGWIVALAGVGVAVASMGALALVGVNPLLPPTPMLPVIVLAVTGVTLALAMPLTLRFGIMGIIGFLVVTQLAGVALLLASALFRMQAVQGIFSAVTDALAAGARLRVALGSAGFAAVVLAAVAALTAASYGLAVCIYRRRDF